MKKIIAIVLCMLSTWGAIIVWNFADMWSGRIGVSHIWFDLISCILFICGVLTSALANDRKKEVRNG